MKNKLEIQNLKISTFGYEGRTILDIPYYCQNNFDELLICGDEGAGKTTFLYAIAGLFLKLEGKVNWNAKNIYQMSPSQRDKWNGNKVGFIYQNFQISDEISVLDNILLPSGFDSVMCPEHLMHKAEKLADQFGISIYAAIDRMSQAEKQYIAIARALMLDASIIIADDLTAGLEPTEATNLLNQLRTECQKDDKMLIMASNDAVVYAQMKPKLKLKDGRIVDAQNTIQAQLSIA